MMQTVVNGVSMASLYILMAIGLTYVFSIMRIINFAHGEILMVGAYISLFSNELLGVNLFIAMLISMASVGFFGIVLERILFRPRKGEDLNLLVLSLGLAITIQNLALVIFGPEDRGYRAVLPGVLGFQSIFISKMRLVAFLVALLCIVGSHIFLTRTKAGIAMQAVSQDPEGAALQGISLSRFHALAFGIGCCLAAASGTLLGTIYGVSPFMGAAPVMKAFIIIILGGLGSMMGCMMGGFILGIVESFVATYFGATIQEISAFLILLLVLILKPEGLFGFREE